MAYSWSDVCRVCMRLECEVEMVSIFQNNSVAAKIIFVTDLQVEHGDGLPSAICKRCNLRLNSAHKFKQESLASDIAFRQNYYQSTTEDDVPLMDMETIKSQVNLRLGDGFINLERNPFQTQQTSYDTVFTSPSPQFNQNEDVKITVDNIDYIQTMSDVNCGVEESIFPAVVKEGKIFDDLSAIECESYGDNLEVIIKSEPYATEEHQALSDVLDLNSVMCEPVAESAEENHERCFVDECGVVYEMNNTCFEILGLTDDKDPLTVDTVKNKTNSNRSRKTKHNPKQDVIETINLLLEDNGVSVSEVVEKKSNRRYRARARKRKPERVAVPTKEIMQCDICSKSFLGQKRLDQHYRIHKREFACPICARIFTKKNHMQRHVEGVHKQNPNVGVIGPHKCDKCDQSFHFKIALFAHVKSHIVQPPQSHPCHVCDKVFAKRANLVQHLMIHSTEKPFVCSYCDAAFKYKAHLNRHEHLHSGIKNFQCSVCGKCFARNSLLNVHHRTHSGEKPYKCSQCDRAFSNHTAYSLHLQRHKGLKPHMCELCGARFLTSSILKRHLRVHTGERPYPCNLCGVKFRRRHHLRSHLRSHAGEKKFECAHCQLKFSQKVSLIAHLRNHHL